MQNSAEEVNSPQPHEAQTHQHTVPRALHRWCRKAVALAGYLASIELLVSELPGVYSHRAVMQSLMRQGSMSHYNMQRQEDMRCHPHSPVSSRMTVISPCLFSHLCSQVYDNDGHIVTNYHVLQSLVCQALICLNTTEDSSLYNAKSCESCVSRCVAHMLCS